MSRECSFKNEKFANKGDELSSHQKAAELLGDQKRLEAVQGIRSAISNVGLGATSIEHLSDEEANQGGGLMALAYYQPSSTEIGLGSVDAIMAVSDQVGQDAKTTTEQILRHEMDHKKADLAEGANQTRAVLTYLFGHEEEHAIEEAMASRHTPFDAYDQERSIARKCARELNITNDQLLDIKLEGNYEALFNQAIKVGLISLKTENESASNSGQYEDIQLAA